MKITPFTSATELPGRLRAGEVASRELLDSYLQRIECHNPGLNAVVTFDAVPIGRSPGGLPVGMQITGPYFEDRSCIEFAILLADVAGGFEAPPGFE